MSGRRNHHARSSERLREPADLLFDDPDTGELDGDELDRRSEPSPMLLDDVDGIDDFDDFDDYDDEPLRRRRQHGYRDFDDWN